jgi:hypothetical protein
MFENKVFEADANALAKEAESVGVAILDRDVVQVGEHGAIEFLKQSVSLGLLGTAETNPTHLQIYQLDAQPPPFIYIAAYQNISPLPGETHVRLPGSLPEPVTFYYGGMLRKNKWFANEQVELEAHLGGDPELAAATKVLSWKKSAGDFNVNLDWTVQLRSLGDGTSHLAFQAGNYGKFLLNNRVGLKEFLALARAIEPLIYDEAYPAQAFSYEVPSTSIFAQFEAIRGVPILGAQ